LSKEATAILQKKAEKQSESINTHDYSSGEPDRAFDNVLVCKKRAQPFEVLMAKEIADHYGCDITLLRVREIDHMKMPDGLLGNLLIEMKRITGKAARVSDRFKDATKQSNNIYLKIENPEIKLKDVWRELILTKRSMVDRGSWNNRKPQWLFVQLNGKFHEYNLQQLVEEGKL